MEYHKIALAEMILFPLLNLCMLANWGIMMGVREAFRVLHAGRGGLSERSLQPNRSLCEFLCWRKRRATLIMELQILDDI